MEATTPTTPTPTPTTWARTATLTLQRLQASIDAVHARLHARSRADASARVRDFSARVTRWLLRVWHAELNGLVAEQMDAVGLGILVLVSEWEGQRAGLEREGVLEGGGDDGVGRGGEGRGGEVCSEDGSGEAGESEGGEGE
ncbi:hypothetical protein NpPPO83_00009718 [Neofusicoccum parvum]|uniref:Uncharacterized protein n=1 Tax=Neofusicoccum parvum TaxID=310453 RepID=A0ACB5S1J1_9PEZI|nr:hypothetical protein NpPPO83_00009718 [Neofusicoccum parvum]